MSHLATIVPTRVVHLIIIGRLVIPIVVNGIVNLTLYAIGLVVGVGVFFLTSTLGGLYICLAHVNLLLTLPRCVEIYITESFTITCDIIMKNYSAPSSLAEMTSWLLLLSMVAFPLIKVTEILLKSWLVGSLSSQPFFLARACPSRLTTSVATQ